MKVAAVILLAGVAVLAASCGGKKTAATTTAQTSLTATTSTTGTATTPALKPEKLAGSPIAGKKVWVTSKCGACHTLKAAGSTGTIGMDFDYLKPSQAEVAGAVTAGGDIMPAYPSLSVRQVNDLAAFVYKSTH